MNVLARTLLNTVAFMFLASTELAQVGAATARCRLVGHEGRWDYKATSGEWLCLCVHCDRELGRHRL